MDAQRLITSTRHALAQARSVPPALAEAWQACAVVEAVASLAAVRLAQQAEPSRYGSGVVEIAGALVEAAGHAAACVGRPPDDGGGAARARRLTAIRDVEGTVRDLRTLIHETAEALIVLACGAGEQELYWRCIDSVDAVSECQDLAADLLRAVTAARPPADPGADTGDAPADAVADAAADAAADPAGTGLGGGS
ncbi:hypothetical protein GXW83_26110 [Streptacidiphilus sp. PB12-B1b]|uniref:DUF6099 family protein n=1 Tax=Streptacidiphilus sp. PB12-B1b TaxID=2705012 RepID=UPI0015FDEDBD|nr:DUF6099 family protein [Streptacidiphilus sp. PB12-B1b]QMU78663.1 hypothetical protein GXW83_26110 [Streptacidiphilus sp. PB12-B1b]